MKRPWQIWTLFALCTAVVLPSVAWLSLRILQLDHAESLARHQAALEENISVALWRMDTFLMPLLAQEAARSPLMYQSTRAFELAGEVKPNVAIESERATSFEFVRLYFQLSSDGRCTSPQVDEKIGRQTKGILDDRIAAETPYALLHKLQRKLVYETLLRNAPAEVNSSFDARLSTGNELVRQQHGGVSPVVTNAYESDAPPRVAGAARNSNAAAAPAEGYVSASQTENVQRSWEEKSQNDLFQRNRAFQAYAQTQVVEPPLSANSPLAHVSAVSVGVSRPIWVGNELLLVRRAQVNDETFVQGCWLNWQGIQEQLQAETSDLVPQITFAPVLIDQEVNEGRVLATLPVRVIAPHVVVVPRNWTPIQLALITAWACIASAFFALALLFWGVVTLSERRAAFVAAVTHELRTPLTTFRMYSEMLANDMAPVNRRQDYLRILQSEANRLTHLVDNVLSYARLERGKRSVRKTSINVRELLSQWTPQLAERAAQAGFVLTIDMKPDAASAIVTTDPQAVGQILSNLVDNSTKYANVAGNRRIEISSEIAKRKVVIQVKDFGPGLSTAQRRQLFKPFCKTVHEAAVTAPGVGLGLSLCRRLAKEIGGRLDYQPASDGACFALELPLAGK
jgi:signal transduction histidine kinase